MPVGGTLHQALIMAAENALNQAMRLDPGTHGALLDLLRRPIAVAINPPPLTLHLVSDGQRLHLQQEGAEEPGVTLSGTPLALLSMSLGDRTALHQGRVSLTGDATLAHRLQQVLEKLEPDWEGALAEAIGDVPAHFLGQRIRQTLNWTRDAHQALLANIEDYVQEETRTLPARNEAEALLEDIGELRLDADRLDARVRQLENRSDPEST